MLDTHTVARSLTVAGVHAGEPSPACLGRGDGGWSARAFALPRRRMVADSRTAPAVGTSDRRHAAQRHRRDRRCRLPGRRARHAVRPKASACRSSRLARGRSIVENAVGRAAAGLAVGHADGRPRRRLARFRAAASGPWPPSHGGRAVRPRESYVRTRRRLSDAGGGAARTAAVNRCGGQQPGGEIKALNDVDKILGTSAPPAKPAARRSSSRRTAAAATPVAETPPDAGRREVELNSRLGTPEMAGFAVSTNGRI